MYQMEPWKPLIPQKIHAVQMPVIPHRRQNYNNYHNYYNPPIDFYNSIDVYRPKQECEGLENLLKDIEIVALILGIISLIKGVASLIGSTLAILFNKINVYGVGVPSRIMGILRFVGVEIPIAVENVFLAVELFFTGLEAGFWVPFETVNNFVHFLGESLAVLSLTLAFITAFDDLWKDDLETIIGRRAFRFVQNYGCIPGFDAEAIVQRIFALLS